MSSTLAWFLGGTPLLPNTPQLPSDPSQSSRQQAKSATSDGQKKDRPQEESAEEENGNDDEEEEEEDSSDNDRYAGSGDEEATSRGHYLVSSQGHHGRPRTGPLQRVVSQLTDTRRIGPSRDIVAARTRTTAPSSSAATSRSSAIINIHCGGDVHIHKYTKTQFVMPNIPRVYEEERQAVATVANCLQCGEHPKDPLSNSIQDIFRFQAKLDGPDKTSTNASGAFDTGADDNFVTRRQIQVAGLQGSMYPSERTTNDVFEGLEGKTYVPKHKIRLSWLDIEKQVRYSETFYVVEDAPFGMILGKPFMVKHKLFEATGLACARSALPLRRPKNKVQADSDDAMREQRYRDAEAARAAQIQSPQNQGAYLNIEGRQEWVNQAEIQKVRSLISNIASGRDTWQAFSQRALAAGWTNEQLRRTSGIFAALRQS